MRHVPSSGRFHFEDSRYTAIVFTDEHFADNESIVSCVLNGIPTQKE
jgi:hypothetical protein